MSNRTKRTDTERNKQTVIYEPKGEKYIWNKTKAFFAHPAISASLGGIIVILFQSGIGFTKTYRDMPDQLKEIKESVEDISDSLPQMIAAIEELQTIHANSGNVIRKDLSDIPMAAITLKSDGMLAEYIRSQEITETMEMYLSNPSWAPEEVVAIGSDGTEYKAYDIYNTCIILSYNENGQDIIFSGQINENNHWDGRCLFNVYEDGNFVIATEGNYDDGELIYYEQLFPEGNEWVYSERYSNKVSNVGDTWKYLKVTDIKSEFDLYEPDENDMVVPKEYRAFYI